VANGSQPTANRCTLCNVRIHSLHLEQFRSYQRLDCALAAEDVHVLLGPNGVGKTNFIEAISVLSEGESCLGREEVDLVAWEEHYYRVSAHVRRDDGDEATLEIVSELRPRKRRGCFVNDVRTSAAAFVGTLPTVLFLPQDLSLFTGPPALRRRFLDRTLGQVLPHYRQSLGVYQKVLKQRGALLRAIAQGVGREEDLATWNTVLAHEGARITLRRLELLGVLQCTLPEELERLSESWSDASLRYVRTGEGRSETDIQCEILAALERYQERDILLQATSAGPHRDDWSMLVRGRELPTFASRGQQRTAVLALLFLQAGYTELQRGEKAVILLDDVFSELDPIHQRALLSSLQDHQVLITATQVPEQLADVMVWDVGEGGIRRTASAVARQTDVGLRRRSANS
jgi:DNA replication and repair protein RecF